ncbi:42977_t:CDS:2, partial [Gigaspora margarita]
DEQEIYEETKQENKRIKKDFDEMKEESSVQIISGLQEKLNEKEQINEELISRLLIILYFLRLGD